MHAATFAYDFCNAAERKRANVASFELVLALPWKTFISSIHFERPQDQASPPYSSNAAERKRFVQQLQIAKTQALRGSSTRSPATSILPEDVGHDAIESNDLGICNY